MFFLANAILILTTVSSLFVAQLSGGELHDDDEKIRHHHHKFALIPSRQTGFTSSQMTAAKTDCDDFTSATVILCPICSECGIARYQCDKRQSYSYKILHKDGEQCIAFSQAERDMILCQIKKIKNDLDPILQYYLAKDKEILDNLFKTGAP